MWSQPDIRGHETPHHHRQPCGSRGGRPGFPSLIALGRCRRKASEEEEEDNDYDDDDEEEEEEELAK